MNDDKCPFCGAEFIWFRKTRCYETEIVALKAQLADREAKLEAWRDLADIVRPMDELKAVQKLEEMGEV